MEIEILDIIILVQFVGRPINNPQVCRRPVVFWDITETWNIFHDDLCLVLFLFCFCCPVFFYPPPLANPILYCLHLTEPVFDNGLCLKKINGIRKPHYKLQFQKAVMWREGGSYCVRA